MTSKGSLKSALAEAILVVMIGFIFFGFILGLLAWFVFPVLTSHSYWVRLGLGALALPVIAPIAWLVTRKGNEVKVSFLTLIITSAIGCPLFSVGALGVANSIFDFKPKTARTAQIIEKKHLNEQRNSHPYRLVVRSWLPNATSIELIVEQELFYLTQVGQFVIVNEGPGWFGWPHAGSKDVFPYPQTP